MNYKTIANCAVTNETLSPENTIMTPCNQPLSASFLRSYTRKLRWDQQPIQCPLCRNDKQFTKRLTEKGINTAPFDKSNYTTYENIKKLKLSPVTHAPSHGQPGSHAQFLSIFGD